MKHKNYKAVARCFLVCVLLAIFAYEPPTWGQDKTESETRRDVSPPLGETQKEPRFAVVPKDKRAIIKQEEHAVKPIPLPEKKSAVGAAARLAPTGGTGPAPTKLKATIGVQFEGVGEGLNYVVQHAPPDTNGSVGITQYVQWVNEALAVFDKRTGAVLSGPTDGNALWKGFGGKCEHSNDGDPITLYDKAANRWVMTQFAVTGGPPFSQCIAVSKTADALGEYFRYEFQFSDFNDYPKFGVWPDGYYASFNMFSATTQQFIGAKACAFEREKMLTGDSARMHCSDVPNLGGLLPSDWDGATPPPAGSPNYFLNFGDNALNLWKFHVDWNNPAGSTFSGPVATQVAPFDPACLNMTCVPKPRTTQRLEPLSDRLMFRLAYRNMGDHETLVVNHSVKTASGSGIRWYELRNPGGTMEVKQQATYAPDALYRWMGSVVMDKVGNMAMGYSVSSNQMFPSIRYTGRSVTDPPNTMALEQSLVNGKGSQAAGLERWGDYSSISVDPSDDCTLWFTSQYLAGSGKFNWHTRVASIKFPNCQ